MPKRNKCFWYSKTLQGADYCCLIDMPLLYENPCNGCSEYMEDKKIEPSVNQKTDSTTEVKQKLHRAGCTRL